MRSQTGNSLSTLMFLVPLLGVPLMAIFGVPQFVPVIASSVSDQPTKPLRTTRLSGGVGESAAPFVFEQSPSEFVPSDDERLHDLFRPAARARRDSRPLHGDSPGRETKFVETTLGADTWLTQTSAEAQAAEKNQTLNDLFGTASSSASRTEPRGRARPRVDEFSNRAKTAALMTESEHSNEGLTWREAVRRLNALGIQEFRLEPGQQVGEFYFACEFAPDRDVRITRRFEAEAREPLLAVAAVLRQIDEWLPRR